jgi:hypothetical protein
MTEDRVTSHQKQTVAQRANYCCEYCLSQLRYSPDPFSIEHIIPLSRGGLSHLDNLAFACQGCNSRKYTSTAAIDPISGETVALYHPRQERWNDHFAWNNDFTLMLGLTPTGRATIENLQLNRAGVVNLRQVLHSAGKHPPLEDD